MHQEGVKVSLEQVHPTYTATPMNHIEKEHFERGLTQMLAKKGVQVQAELEDNPSVEELRWDDFSEEQKAFFGQLTKFTGSTRNKYSMLGQNNMSRKQELFIKSNLNFLTSDQVVKYNDEQMRWSDHRLYSKGLGMVTFMTSALYHLATAPPTRRLHKELIRSGGMGVLACLGYYKYQEAIYKQKIHKFYLVIKSKKKGLE